MRRAHQKWWFVTLVVAGTGLTVGCCQSPTDEELISRFRNQRGEFEELVNAFQRETGFAPMVRRDGYVLSVPEARAKDYRHQLRELRLEAVNRSGFNEVKLTAYDSGSPAHCLKGYSFNTSQRNLLRTVTDLDRTAEQVLLYRHIEGDWYLFQARGGGS